VAGLATGLGDKAVSLFYETLLRTPPSQASQVWIDRCRRQIVDTLDVLEQDRARRADAWWVGPSMSHADVAVGRVLRVTPAAHPRLFETARWPRLASHAQSCEALDVFREIAQAFTVTT